MVIIRCKAVTDAIEMICFKMQKKKIIARALVRLEDGNVTLSHSWYRQIETLGKGRYVY